jgi:hypothetical protein
MHVCVALFISNLMLGVETKEISEVSLYMMTLFMGWWKHVGPRVTMAKQYGTKI